MTHHKLAIIGISAAALGVIGLVPFAVAATRTENIPVTTAIVSTQAPVITPVDSVVTTPVITSKAVRIEVPAAGINLSVIDGNFDTHTAEWTLTKDKAQFALPSTQPNNQAGNTLIYGHNTPQVFARLHKLAAGAEAKVYTEDGHIFTYTLRASQTVRPDDVSIFAYQGAPQLTLQTCTGVWSEARKFFFFDFTSIQ